MSLSSRPLCLLFAAASACWTATASAQFSPYGSATIDNTTVTAAQTLASGTGTITGTGAISYTGTSAVLTLSGTGTTLLNSGLIQNSNGGTSGNPRALLADGTNIQITNQVGGVIQSSAQDAVRSSVAGTSITLTNYGTITANYNNTTVNPQQGVDWNSITTGSNTINNYGVIQANGNDAVRPGVNGIVNNFAGGKLFSTNNSAGTSSDGVDAQTNTGVKVTNSGLIEAGRHGITGGNTTTGVYAMSITNNAGATIQGDNGSGVNIDGINGSETVTINNAGTITGNGSTLNSGEADHDGDGVDVDGLVNLTNSGTIRSINAIANTSEGITVGGGTIVNNAGGLIEGDIASGNTSGAVGRGITVAGIDTGGSQTAIYANTVITNGGTIRGQTDAAIAIGGPASGFTVTVTNNAGGLIEGGGATAAAIQTGADNDTVNNAGRIVADSSNLAIDMGAGNNTLNISGGSASISGNVSGGVGGTNTLTITPGSGNTFAYSGSFSNFNSAQIGAGRVIFAGANTYTGATTIASGATLVANTPAALGSATGYGAVTVQSGGILAGTGRVAGAVTLASGGTIAPGDGGVGTLSLGATLNVSNGSSFTYELGADDLHSDRLTLAGTFAFTGTGTMTFNITNVGLVPGTYDLIDFAASTGLTTANLRFGNVPSGFAGTFVLSGTELAVNITAVPEPAAVVWLSLAFVGVTMVACQRRCRN